MSRSDGKNIIVPDYDRLMLENRILSYYNYPKHRNKITYEEEDFKPRLLGDNSVNFSDKWASAALNMNNKITRGNPLTLPDDEKSRFETQLGPKGGRRRKRRGTKRRRVSSKKKRSTRRRR